MTETNYAGQPRYCQIRDDLMTAIREQRLRPNEQIPTEVEIMRQYGVSRTTVRRAIQDLVDNGITMAGGSSLLRGLTTVISNATGLDVRLAEDPLTCVARGTAVYLENLEIWKDTLESDADDV